MDEVTGTISRANFCEPDAWSYSWTIDDFMAKTERVLGLRSPLFFIRNNNDLVGWRLTLLLHVKGEEPNNNISIFLERKQPKNSVLGPMVVDQFSMYVLSKNGKVTNKIKVTKPVALNKNAWGWQNILSRNMLKRQAEDLLPNGNLTFFCKIVLPDGSIAEMCSEPKMKRLCQLADDQDKMLRNPKFSDITLLVEGKEIKAHKAILAARSSVFSSMFDTEMQEAKQNLVEIEDIPHDVVIELLNFIYTGSTGKLYEMAEQLLFAADKYDLNDLRNLCEESLYEQLTVENACKTLILADLHSRHRLEDKVFDFILSNLEVLETEGFKLISQNNMLNKKLIKALISKSTK